MWCKRRPITVAWVIVAVAASNIPQSNRSCTVLTFVDKVSDLFDFLFVTALLAARTFAVWNRDILMTTIVVTVGCTSAAINVYGCFLVSKMGVGKYNQLSDIATFLAMFNDFVVIVITLLKTFRHVRTARRLHIGVSLSSTLLECSQSIASTTP
ncbi:uncharacterized protein PHACADRAFT_265439 [Phanerochaete carnosa HHB-10118-sp]|uniref:Uncharacterized protein n=1 Tax=Phanerochaete carnosa (strain HHB-10118-sp) TaxID=650164 RepID=K5VF38_PHACS|nr:uncharacterized protein PHACADRAFT_265439 [Phanerochaete carnosa HHB-10118-sp]EKM49768.1 hypothetical protein PHACADRAFT_265439 [Phanerochaete carnosa HHB-10118-sp]